MSTIHSAITSLWCSPPWRAEGAVCFVFFIFWEFYYYETTESWLGQTECCFGLTTRLPSITWTASFSHRTAGTPGSRWRLRQRPQSQVHRWSCKKGESEELSFVLGFFFFSLRWRFWSQKFLLPEPPARLVVQAVAEVVPASKVPSRVVNHTAEAVLGLHVLVSGKKRERERKRKSTKRWRYKGPK